MRVNVDGLDAVVSDLQFEAGAARVKAERVVVNHAGKAADRMRRRVPVDTGRTRDSITADSDATVEDGDVYAEAGPEWFVARFIENGTARRGPRPFVEPAYDETVPGFIDDMDGICGL